MKRLNLILILALALSWLAAPAPVKAANAPGQVASYSIQATLNPKNHTLEGRETITYQNTSSQPITDLVFHLYLNAFKNDQTIFMKEAAGQMRGVEWDPEHPGWIEVDNLRIVMGPDLALQPLEDGTLARADLPQPLEPGKSLQLQVTFHELLPKVFARTGYAGDFYLVGQWFPKLGVWENGAWNAYPFHANSEFFADFGNYDVQITLPKAYIVGAVGLPVGEQQNGDGTQTVSYQAEGVIDFAFAACPRFRSADRKVNGVTLEYLYLPEHDWTVEPALEGAEAALVHFGEWYGPYPYPKLTVVDVPDEGVGAGGMEYPTFITSDSANPIGMVPQLSKMGLDHTVELVVEHEAGHQWWQSTVAFNEAEEPWLDEGFTDYSTVRLSEELYPKDNSAVQVGSIHMSYLDMRRMEYVGSPDVPMYGKAWDFSSTEYGVAAYSKPALSLLTLEGALGSDEMLKVMSTFYQRYQYQHPTTQDFRATAEEVTGQNLSWFFDGLVYGKGAVDYSVRALGERSVTVERLGSLTIPTQVQVTFADGTTRIENWNGEPASQTFTYSNGPQVKCATVDPERLVKVDLDWSDNGMCRQADLTSWSALVVRLLYWIQNGLMALGGL